MAPSLQTFPRIDAEHLHLRPLGPDDASAFRAMTDEPAITDVIDFLPTSFKLTDAQQLIAGNGDGRNCFWGVWLRESDALLGADEIEIGCWLASSARGRGFGGEAASAIVRALTAAYPARRTIAECRPQNKASWSLLERIGFHPDGRAGVRPGRKRLIFA